MKIYKRKPIVYSVATTTEGELVYGTVDCTATDGGFSGTVQHMRIEDRNGNFILLSDIEAIESLYAAIYSVLNDTKNDALSSYPAAWEEQK